MSLGQYTQKTLFPLGATPPNSNTPDHVYSISIYHITIFFCYNRDAQLHVLQQGLAAATERESNA